MSDFKNREGFTKWYDQKSWGSKKGSFGRSKETTGKLFTMQEFFDHQKNSKIQQSSNE